MYKAQQEAPQAGAGAGPQGGGASSAAGAQDGVVDADFEEVDPDKKDK
jgi:molecular chaperone DnaK